MGRGHGEAYNILYLDLATGYTGVLSLSCTFMNAHNFADINYTLIKRFLKTCIIEHSKTRLAKF